MTKKELLEIIDRAARDESTTLDLSCKGIKELPAEIGKLTNLTELDLSNNKLSSLPAELGQLTGLKELSLSGNQLNELPSEIKKLTNIMYLDLRYNQLKSLPKEIGKLVNLETLHLHNNELTCLPEEIVELTNLTKLTLSSNQFNSAPMEIFALINLKNLDLHDNQLNLLPQKIGQLVELRKFSLDRNRLNKLPKEIGLLTKLERLDLWRNEITELPKEIGQLNNLRLLLVNNNKLTSIPEEIKNLSNLAALEIGNNSLTSIPSEIWELANLMRLGMHNNNLEYLPSGIGKLGKLIKLVAHENRLTSISSDVGKLTNLTELYLGVNQLNSIPKELGQLTNLTTLYLNGNQLTCIPKELGQLTNLTALYLGGNQLTSIPKELVQLTNLTTLYLNGNQLTCIPKELGQLTNLTALYLGGNKLTSIPKELVQLTNLTTLHLNGNQLTCIPKELGQLTNLTGLYLNRNQLTCIPKELGQLINLTALYLSRNQLTCIPKELGQLINLTALYLSRNQLTCIPKELGQLINLTGLYLSRNQLTSLPKELGQLTKLEMLSLDQNELTSVPEELGHLTNLVALGFGKNPLESPPLGIVAQGTGAILAYLREPKRRQWVSKLLFVGEGGVGKTSLLRALRGEKFIEGLETTHGIGVEKLEIAHPKEAEVGMDLNTWDFGGQQIYHATHQFFLTNRALFVLVWDARHGWEAGKLYNWLDRIQAKAPESPVMIVEAHIDERDADLPLEDLRKRYPQIEGHYKVSNKKGRGIKEFRAKLAEVAEDLPLMGEEWPASWLDATNEIRDLQESCISPRKLHELMRKHEVTEGSAKVLAQWLHELGDILYFREDEELNDTVILDPVWVTEAISDVLESKEIIGKDGIFTRQHMNKLWSDVDEGIRGHFLRLMERFDLSYRTLENREISLVVECLPLDPPDYEEKWDKIKEKEGCKEISMKFELSSVPAGIPTWFIARSHRFTTHTHWRLGALFGDSKEERHLGLIEAYPHDRYLRLTVRGPAPHNFFTLLRDGLELTLARFPGLKIGRTVPCPGHDGGECKYEFDFGHLQKAIEREKPVLEMQCQEAFENVLVPKLLFGLHWSTQDAVVTRIDEMEDKVLGGQETLLTELQELRALTQRRFTSLFNAMQELEESHCPNVFAVLPKDEKGWLKNIFGQKMVLQLYCQAPGCWHPTIKGGRYEIKQLAEFLKDMGPYILKLAKVIKYAAPVAGAAAGLYAGPIGAVMEAGFAKKLAGQIKLMEELAKKLSERDYLETEMLERAGGGAKAERIEGAELRALRKLLDEVDPKQEWGGLEKVLTPEGHYLWLCEEHVKEYKK